MSEVNELELVQRNVNVGQSVDTKSAIANQTIGRNSEKHHSNAHLGGIASFLP